MRSGKELWLALLAVVMSTIAYLGIAALLGGIPAASAFFGHSLGILGFALMLATETLYSLRKRSRSARWGRTANWLSFHIFTGIVGPYLVLLHTSWKFNGLAGLLTLFTLVVMVSGFVGRYIYTAAPRSLDGAELEVSQLREMIEACRQEIRQALVGYPALAQAVQAVLENGGVAPQGAAVLLLRPVMDWTWRLQWWQLKLRMDGATRQQARRLDHLLHRQQALRRQMSSLAAARRLLAVWHTVHIPLGAVLFTLAFFHIVAALYYSTLLR